MNKFHLFVGFTIAIGAALLSIKTCYQTTASNRFGTAFVVLLNIGYCLSMLSRRGAAKEPEFWSLASLIWLASLYIRPGQGRGLKGSLILALKPLALQILLHLWGQRTEAHSLTDSVWVYGVILILCTATYMATAVQLINHVSRTFDGNSFSALAAKSGAFILPLVAFVFKLVLTAKHTPALIPLTFGELHTQLCALDQTLLAQTTFAGCFGGLAFLLIHSYVKNPISAKNSTSKRRPYSNFQCCIKTDCGF